MSERDRNPRRGGRPDRPNRPNNARGTGSARRPDEPALPDDVTASDLDGEARRDLLTLDKTNAENVARHLVMVSRLLEDDPALALEHARAARSRASRVGLVRETVGIAAYNAGEWQEALSELRAARRITGDTALLPLIADAERGLGRPERAIEIARSAEGRALTGDEATEMRIVESGARLDLGEPEKAIVTLQAEDLSPSRTGVAPARLFYAYASALESAGRTDDAITWFMNAASADVEDVTDAEFRLMELSPGDTSETGDTGDTGDTGEDIAMSAAPEPTAAPAETGADQPVESTVDTPVFSDAPTAATSGPAEVPAQATASDGVAQSHPAGPDTAEVDTPDRDMPDRDTADRDTAEPDPAIEKPTEAAVPASSSLASSTALGERYDALLLDLDGTVFAGHRALPGARETLADLTTPRYFVTNNASRRPAEVVDHLVELGFEATEQQVVTSAQSAARLLAEHLEPGSRALVIGTDGLAQEVREVGIGVTRSAADRPAAVIQGHSPDTGWTQLCEAALAIGDGALWIACNTDATLPSERGNLVGNGSMVAAVANATGQQPLVAGKPAAPLMADAIARSKATKPLVVGDRLDTDIEGAHSVGVDSALVLTGVSSVADMLVAPPEQRPTYVIGDLTGLFDDAELLRIGEQDGWEFEVEGDEVTVTRTKSGAPTETLVPALASVIWQLVDEDVIDPTDLVVTGSDDAVRALLDSVGVGRVR